MNHIYGGAGPAFFRLKAQVLPDIIRRLSAARPEELDVEPNAETMEKIAEAVFDHAITLAVKFNRAHQKEALPYDRKVEKLSKIIRAYIHGQDDVSMHMLKQEHRMTLIGFFVVIGVSREIAQEVVDDIVLQPQPEEVEQ